MKKKTRKKVSAKKKIQPKKKKYELRHDVSFFSDYDIHLFKEGNHIMLHERLGSHACVVDGVAGVYFAVWAPNALEVSVVGDFNSWKAGEHTLNIRWDDSGIWEGFIADLTPGAVYKFEIRSLYNDHSQQKSDPFSFYWEEAPKSASRVWDLNYLWMDEKWMEKRHKHNSLNAPWSVYELHLGSWKRNVEKGDSFLTYRELAPLLTDYILEMGYTHVELMPVMEHPFYPSWGYQPLGFFAPTSRYGTPQDFKFFIDYLHQHDIGIILDWVPSHFPTDGHGLGLFDGTCLYEHADERQGFHPDWKSNIFNFGRNEVRCFLFSSAYYWLNEYHIDALRVDAVASMLYLDYSRKDGEWIPNRNGGNENIEAISFLKKLNEIVFTHFPDTQTIAEESTAWPMVSHPTFLGGLGFGMKWNMGWMNDSLKYFETGSVHRKYTHQQMTFSIWYAFSENFVLSLSHDEVVHGKKSIIEKMPGDKWQKFANARLLYGYMFTHPGKKLLFMGNDFGQHSEWYQERSLDWHLCENTENSGLQKWVRDLNHAYTSLPALFSQDFSQDGFEWVDFSDYEQSIFSYLRKGANGEVVLTVINATPVPRYDYRLGVPRAGRWNEILNSDAEIYGGSGIGNQGCVSSDSVFMHGYPNSVTLTLPPLGILIFEPEKD